MSKELTLSKKAFITRLILGLILINLFVSGLAGFFIYQSRIQYDEKAALETRNLSRVLEEYIDGIFAKVDLGVNAAVDEAERQISSGGIDEKLINEYLSRMLGRLSWLSALRIADANGRIIFGVKPEEAERLPALINDRDYFVELRDNPDSGLVFSRPLVGRILGKQALIMARRINGPDRSFEGIAFGVFTLESFTKIFETIDVGKNGVISLRDRDLGLVVRSSGTDSKDLKVGSIQVPDELRDIVQKGHVNATFQAVSLLDGVERLYTMQKVPSYSGYLIVGEALKDYLAPWLKESFRIFAAVILFVLTTFIAAFKIYYNWNFRRNLIQAMLEQEEKFHTIADNTHDWEYWISGSGDFIFTSPSCLEITGYDREAFYSDKTLLYAIIHPDDRAGMADHLNIAEHEKVHGSHIFRIIHRIGDIRWIEHACISVMSETKGFLGIRASNRDITERKNGEAERQRLLAILEASINEIYVLRGDTLRFDYVSRSALSNLGYTMDQMRDMSPCNLIPGYSENKFRDLVAPLVLKEKGKLVFQAELTRADGTTYPVEIHLQAVRIGEYCRYLAILFDISERLRMQKELADKVTELEKTLTMVKQLEGIIPICMYCKKIRDDRKSWQQLEAYISSHSEASFSHGICPDCYAAGLWKE